MGIILGDTTDITGVAWEACEGFYDVVWFVFCWYLSIRQEENASDTHIRVCRKLLS